MKHSLRDYLAWGSVELFFTVSIIIAVLFAITSNDIAQQLNADESQLGTLSGAFFITYSIGQLVLGSLMGRLPARWILGFSCMISAVGCFMLAASHSITTAMGARILLGFGLSTTFVGTIFVVSRRFSDNFSFMASISQALGNVAGAGIALLGSFTLLLTQFRPPFVVMGVVLVLTAILIVLLIGPSRSGAADQVSREPNESLPLGATVKVCFINTQFWMAVLFYGCLFGTLLAYSDLWNIQFQLSYFKHNLQEASFMNSMIPLGVMVGCITAGAWAKAAGSFVLPARCFGVLTVLLFAIMLVIPLSVGIATGMNFLIGFGIAGSILGLTPLQVHLPKGAVPMATAFTITFGYVLGGIIQPAIGASLQTPVSMHSFLASVLSETPNFSAYQQGMLWLVGTVSVGAFAGFFLRAAPR